MGEISLTQGEVTVVDDADFKKVSSHPWYYRNGYAARAGNTFMQNVIYPPPEGMIVDHINGDSLDNRRENLRHVTWMQNTRNRKSHSNTSSKYKGVTRRNDNGRWRAQIGANYKHYNLGTYATEEEAAKAYNEASVKYHGEFGRLNKLEEEIS